MELSAAMVVVVEYTESVRLVIPCVPCIPCLLQLSLMFVPRPKI